MNFEKLSWLPHITLFNRESIHLGAAAYFFLAGKRHPQRESLEQVIFGDDVFANDRTGVEVDQFAEWHRTDD